MSTDRTDNDMKFRSYEERKEAQEKLRRESNRRTHQEYRLPPVPPPPPAGKHSKYRAHPDPHRRHSPVTPDPVPSASGIPTRDMEPVKLPLAKKVDNKQFADVISLHDRRKKE